MKPKKKKSFLFIITIRVHSMHMCRTQDFFLKEKKKLVYVVFSF